MLRASSLRFVLCLACLASTAFAQNTFSRRSYTHVGERLLDGDFNRDGKPDLVGSNFTRFSVLLNNGDGTFRGPVNTTVAPHRFLVTADFNRDGRTDLEGCLLSGAPDTGNPTNEFALWMGNGAATFSQPRRFTLAGTCRGVMSEDFDQDGKQDIAAIWTLMNPDNTPNNGITVFFGDGAGNVSHSLTSDHISAPSENGECAFDHLVAGNYDRSGSPDVVIATDCPMDFGAYTLLFGKGTGTGHFAFSTTLEDSFSRVTPAQQREDVDQDGRLDLVVRASFSAPHGVSGNAFAFLVNRDAGGTPRWEWRTVQSYGAEDDCDSGVSMGVAADLNGDGIKDAAFGELRMPSDCSSTSYNLAIKMGRADGSYGPSQRFSFATEPRGVTSADFDRDGRLDLAVVTGNSTQVFLNRNSIATCSANATLRTVKNCAPSAVTGNTLQLRANTTSGSPVTGMKVYIDGAEAFFSPNETINKKLSLASGSHQVTVRAWDSQGSFSSTKTVSVGGGSTCSTPTTNRSINICSPVNESTVSNPVRVTAAIRTSNTYYGAKIYIDGVSRHSTNSKQVDASFTLSAGRHRVSVQAYDSQGSFTKPVYVNVR